MLSGIEPADTLSKFNIPLVHEASEVGKNLFDHFALYQLWKLRDAERDLALGSPLLTNPALFKGFPTDWAINEAVPIDRNRRESSGFDPLTPGTRPMSYRDSRCLQYAWHARHSTGWVVHNHFCDAVPSHLARLH
jgi:hypothetical protein